MLDKLTKEHFDEHLDTEFTVTRDEVTFKVKLAHVEALGAPIAKGDRGPFSVTFEGEESAPEHASQGIYKLEHAEMDTVELFLTRVVPRMHSNAVTLEGIFS